MSVARASLDNYPTRHGRVRDASATTRNPVEGDHFAPLRMRPHWFFEQEAAGEPGKKERSQALDDPRPRRVADPRRAGGPEGSLRAQDRAARETARASAERAAPRPEAGLASARRRGKQPVADCARTGRQRGARERGTDELLLEVEHATREAHHGRSLRLAALRKRVFHFASDPHDVDPTSIHDRTHPSEVENRDGTLSMAIALSPDIAPDLATNRTALDGTRRAPDHRKRWGHADESCRFGSQSRAARLRRMWTRDARDAVRIRGRSRCRRHAVGLAREERGGGGRPLGVPDVRRRRGDGSAPARW